tara:strand:+ start:209 stop:442 length:234 start_codon:yes stop_codon:yes gene_type:complete
MALSDIGLRNPFTLSIFVGLVSFVLAFITALAITFSDLNDDALPRSVFNNGYTDNYRAFLRAGEQYIVDLPVGRLKS